MEQVTTQQFYKPGFMDLSAYSLEDTAAGPEWDVLVQRCDQGSIFSLSDFLLNVHDSRPRLWRCLKGGETKAALVVMESEDGRSCISVDHVIHTGILLIPPQTPQSDAQTISENFRIITFVVDELARRYDRVFVSTHPSFPDIRPFLWHNYGTSEPKFEVAVRYTSMVSLEGVTPGAPLDQNPAYGNFSKSRRQEVRYGIREGVKTVIEQEVDIFLEFYRLTFARQDESMDDHYFRRLRGLVEGLLATGKASMYLSRTAGGEPGSIAVIGLDSKRAYYLFGANNPELRDQHTGTMVLWDAFLDLAASGVKEVDLEGVNSPLRGHFKLSFGGSMLPYYHIRLQNR